MTTRLPCPRKPGQPVTLDWLRANTATYGDCWLWRGAVNSHGYASVKVAGRVVAGHVLAYTLAHGPIAPGMERDHRCGLRGCINPAHLEPVTHTENVRRGRSHVYRDGRCPRCGCTRLYVPKPGNNHSRRCARCTNETRKRREGRV